jgi:hypothetical protein
VSGVRVAGLGNPQLTWEQQEDINVGLDFSILNNRIYGEFDVFSRKVKPDIRESANRYLESCN